MNGTRSNRYEVGLLLFLICLQCILPANGQIATGGTYTLEQAVIASGGGSSTGTGYAVDGTAGQSAAGSGLMGSSYGLDDGFWTFLLSVTPSPTATPTDTPTATPTNTPTATPTATPVA